MLPSLRLTQLLWPRDAGACLQDDEPGEVDEEGIEPKDIELVTNQAPDLRSTAFGAMESW